LLNPLEGSLLGPAAGIPQTPPGLPISWEPGGTSAGERDYNRDGPDAAPAATPTSRRPSPLEAKDHALLLFASTLFISFCAALEGKPAPAVSGATAKQTLQIE
jgi:hypothetical protein